ncbi:MAG: outer membrane lipoprotein carrier protein LolA, partial [Stenotrophomonas maltophilia]|nr:outer membrane lipoprotein carrier protein LolA [Stenotrophomonas maltophilia]
MNRANRFARALLCALLLVAAPLVQAADPAIDAITQAVARPEKFIGL